MDAFSTPFEHRDRPPRFVDIFEAHEKSSRVSRTTAHKGTSKLAKPILTIEVVARMSEQLTLYPSNRSSDLE